MHRAQAQRCFGVVLSGVCLTSEGDYPIFTRSCPSCISLPHLTVLSGPSYCANMRVLSPAIRLVTLLSVLSLGYAAVLEQTEGKPEPVPAEEYPLYDQVIDKKFLTSETKLVIIERLTVMRLYPEQKEVVSLETFRENEYFEGRLPPELVREFVFKNQKPARLEARFSIGVRYRFVSGGEAEEPEVSLAPVPALFSRAVPMQEAPLQKAPPVVDRLAFSRVAFTLRNDHALVYVENNRPDGTGAGFLVWLRRTGKDWAIFDTEVVWTARRRMPGEG